MNRLPHMKCQVVFPLKKNNNTNKISGCHLRQFLLAPNAIPRTRLFHSISTYLKTCVVAMSIDQTPRSAVSVLFAQGYQSEYVGHIWYLGQSFVSVIISVPAVTGQVS